jgi:thymidylate synthase ThyX
MTNPYVSVVSWLNDSAPIKIPEPLGEAADNQFQGSRNEKIVEIAGRSCYDSFGRGRDSKSYHEHIHEVGHTSVHEHVVYPFFFSGRGSALVDLLVATHDCPGLSITTNSTRESAIISINVRALNRLVKHFRALAYRKDVSRSDLLVYSFFHHMAKIAYSKDPRLVSEPEFTRVLFPLPGALLYHEGNSEELIRDAYCLKAGDACKDLRDIASSPYGQEAFRHGHVVFFFSGVSRGLTHEQVRHRIHVGISQRSTRYVSESKTPWVYHPLLEEYLRASPELDGGVMGGVLEGCIESCRDTYDYIYSELSDFLLKRGEDKFRARKQARGAARGFLGNALMTEMVWSASFDVLKYVFIPQRASPFADEEIHRLAHDHVHRILADRYPSLFGA